MDATTDLRHLLLILFVSSNLFIGSAFSQSSDIPAPEQAMFVVP